jgi:hypothetical protein
MQAARERGGEPEMKAGVRAGSRRLGQDQNGTEKAPIRFSPEVASKE